MNKLKLALALSLLMAAQTSMAVPAKPTPSVFTQPDGTTVVLQKVGDERRHITITPEGYPVTLDSKGFYCYAELDQNGKLKASAVKASATDKLSEADLKLVKSLNGRLEKHIATAHSLGLRKIGQETVQPDNTQTRGKIAKIGYLLQVTEEQ